MENKHKFSDKRKLISELGTLFLDWAEIFFNDTQLNSMISKRLVYESFVGVLPKNKNISPSNFTNKLKLFCELKGYVINPIDKTISQDRRIFKRVNGIVYELIYIEAPGPEPNSK